MNFINYNILDGKISVFINKEFIAYKIILYKMGKILLFDDNNIILNNIKIEGNKLRIVTMEDDIIEIEGSIQNIVFKKEITSV